MEFSFALATAQDDAEIRRLLAGNPVPGGMRLAYEREPDYFLGCGPMGDFSQVLAIRHLPSGRLAGIACRAGRRLFVNGAPQQIGYLGQLRIDGAFRSRWLVSRSFRFLRQMHADGRTPAYLTTIIEGNQEAEGILVRRPRRNFPVYRPLSRLHTLSLPAGGRRRRLPRAGLEVVSGGDLPLADVLRFWQTQGPARQFFPCWRAEDFVPGAPLTFGFSLDDLRLAVVKGEIVGTLGLWDQSAYKQTVLCGYGGALRWGRPFYNIASRLRGRPSLPPVGARLPLAHAAFPCVAAGREEIFSILLDSLLALAKARRPGWLALGLCEGDPLLRSAGEFPHIDYCSRLYTVAWEDGAWFHERLDGRTPHIEIAAL